MIINIISKIKAIEENNLSFSADVNDAWYQIRFQVVQGIIKEKNLHQRSNKARLKNTKKENTLRYLIRNNPFLIKKKGVEYIILGNPRKIKTENGEYRDIYTEYYIRDILKCNCVIIEDSHKGKHLEPNYFKKTYYTDIIKILRNKFRIKTDDLDKEQVDLLSRIESELRKEFGYHKAVQELGRRVYRKNQEERVLFRIIFRRVKPKAIFLVCSYGKEGRILAAKDLGIPVIEIQHGVITPLHMGYDFNQKYPKKSFPNYLFSFGDYWKDTVSFPIPEDRVFTVGYPYFEEYIKKNHLKDKEYDVVFISQDTISNELFPFAIKYSLKNKDKKIIYKLHPVEYQRWLQGMPPFDNFIELKNFSIASIESSLYEIQSKSRIQVGVYSTALFEGFGLGCITFLLNVPGIEYMKGFIEKEYGFCISSIEEIRERNEIKTQTSNLFKPGWKENISYQLSALNLIEE